MNLVEALQEQLKTTPDWQPAVEPPPPPAPMAPVAKTTRQLVYPAVVLLVNPETRERYEARAISHAELPDLDRDLGACCYLDKRPRYLVAGVEDPTFDPTIPDDIAAAGWYWHGSFLTHYQIPPPEGCGIVIGMPLYSLADVWAKARVFIATSAALAERHAAEAEKRRQKDAEKAEKKPKKPTAPKLPRPSEQKATQPTPAVPPTVVDTPPPPAPREVVVVEKAHPTAAQQLSMW